MKIIPSEHGIKEVTDKAISALSHASLALQELAEVRATNKQIYEVHFLVSKQQILERLMRELVGKPVDETFSPDTAFNSARSIK